MRHLNGEYRRRWSQRARATGVCALFLLACAGASAELPAVPVPVENPLTEAKRVLGKILFWDEQLSSDDSVACGTCHRPAFGGSDPRVGRHPGKDPGTIDDVLGSPGIASLGADGKPTSHPIFGGAAQVTRRLSPSNFGALWADALFWDGRAGGELRDPLTGEIVIAAGGALESQALDPLLDSTEMARKGREWPDVTDKLERVEPLALASDFPRDVAAAIEAAGSYPALFAEAFGNERVTPVRIAFALASYQRTLVADQTAWDRFEAGDADALSPAAQRGLAAMERLRCVNCHVPPLFSGNAFFNIGLRRFEYDGGRMEVTGEDEDAGDMKVPSLRNVALRPRFMHTGEFRDLAEAIDFYEISRASGAVLSDRDDVPGGGTYGFSIGPAAAEDIRVFLTEGLTDPRARDETFPFDRPTLGSER